MKKKIIGLVFSFTLCFTLLFTYGVKADGLQNTRLGGFTRYDTNIKVVQQGWQKSDCAVLVGGENFPDALSAAPLAKKYNAPIFLVFPTGIDYRITDEFDRLGVKKVFIIGGINIIPTLTEDTLKSKGISYERIYGQNRYETSIDIANKVGTQNGVMVTTGNDYSDALSIAPIAGKLQMPIILSQKDVLTSIQKKFVSNNTIPKAYILGNTDIISDNVASKFPNVQRIAIEDNRFARNLDIINTFKNDIDFSTVILASGADFPDALSGSALAALNGNPVILAGEHLQYKYKESASNNFIEDLLGNNGVKNIYELSFKGSKIDGDLDDVVNATNALNSIKSKLTLDSNFNLKTEYKKYSYDGSNYYVIALHEEKDGLDLCDFYQYKFLVDTETGDTYKLDIDTKEITPLDDMQIGLNTNDKQKALETVADHVTEKGDNAVVECDGIEDKDNMNCYIIHVYDNLYDHISTIDFYYAEIGTGKIYIHDADTDTIKPIN
jgi:putative cell wall-binding protein